MAGTVASCLRKKEKEKTEITEITDYLYLSGCSGLTADRLEALGISGAVCCIKGITHKFPKTIDYLYIPVEDEDTEDLRPYMASVFALIDKKRKKTAPSSIKQPPNSPDENRPTSTDSSSGGGSGGSNGAGPTAGALSSGVLSPSGANGSDSSEEAAAASGGRTLVYCGLGISRSATFVIAFLMIHERMSLIEAYKYVQKRRPIICPNVGFFRQLIEIELELFGKQTVNIIRPVDNVEVPDVVWDEVYDEVMKRLQSPNDQQNPSNRQ